ncbi:hypothetical protein RHMOL_Rhmol10G0214900 [Rhododendron molle]|uniref:Uncharacterized protein n=1 Tax=Rhododendron molle TaxID=49168 RepID=A0ACC0M5U8_RHOML|nr:hypothetical protein RHMOL_Rhmol10G0214900 [Rhododendron molle]
MEGENWLPKMELFRKTSTVWKDIMSIELKEPQFFTKFMENIGLKVGDGKHMEFSNDTWLDGTNLANSFPNLYRILCDKSESIEEVFGRFYSSHQWSFQLRRRLSDWEEEQFQNLKNLLNNCGISTIEGRANQLEWKGCVSKVFFSVKSMYNLSGGDLGSSNNPVYKCIWKNIAPHKTQCFG